MSSYEKDTDLLDVDFARDVPTTAEDVRALEAARQLPPLDTAAYLQWLTLMSDTPTERIPSVFHEPFTL
jgi:hypothetical protein